MSAPPGVVDGPLRGNSAQEVARFLYMEAELLDAWRLEEWLDLFTDECRYVVPSTDDPSGDPQRRLALIDDDRTRLESRVERLLSRRAAREFPHSRTRRLITNVQVAADDGAAVEAVSCFFIVRFHREQRHDFIGRYRHGLVRDAHGLRIARRRAELDHDILDPQGTVSIIV